MIEEILSACEWSPSSLPTIARRSLDERVAASLGEVLRGSDLLRRLCSDTVAMGRVVQAPATFGCLTNLLNGEMSEKEFTDWLDDRLAAEERRRGDGNGHQGQTLWTALGDAAYDSKGRCERMAIGPGAWAGHGDGAPRIVLDIESPNARRATRRHPKRPWRGGDLRPFPVVDRPVLLHRLDEADDLLRLCPPAHAFVMASIRVVVVHHDESGWFTSSSCNQEPGRLTLHNPTAWEAEAPMLANALIHEAVHSFLYALEQDRPLTAISPSEDTPLWPSPWTGAPLTAHALVHAALVWASLASFWALVGSLLTGTNRSAADVLHVRALAGFRGGGLHRLGQQIQPLLTMDGQSLMRSLASYSSW